MVRDPQTALTALNRFGFGARGGAAGDLVNAASDPRGFVKAELDHPGGARLEMPALQPTPELAQAVFAYQAEVKAARQSVKENANAKVDASTENRRAMMERPDMPSESKPADDKSMDD